MTFISFLCKEQRLALAHKRAAPSCSPPHQAQKRRAHGLNMGRARRVPRRAGSASSAGPRFRDFTILKQGWDFYRFSRSLPLAVLLPFYVKSAELLHYPHTLRNKSADVLFMLALICCVRSQSVRDFVTEISGGATPAPVRCGSQSSSS